MKKRYEVVTFTGKTWESADNIEFTSRKKAEARLAEWVKAQPTHKFTIAVNGKLDKK